MGVHALSQFDHSLNTHNVYYRLLAPPSFRDAILRHGDMGDSRGSDLPRDSGCVPVGVCQDGVEGGEVRCQSGECKSEGVFRGITVKGLHIRGC
jgi:hypothetical protein